MKVFVNYNDNRWKSHKVNFAKIVNLINKTKGAEVSIILTNDEEIRTLNREYRKIDKPTNVLSFETGDKELLGDIFISIDTIMRESKSENKTIEDHITHMVVHGVYHLMGYDHLNDMDAKKMESMEIKILKKLGIKNPYNDEKNGNIFNRIIGKISDKKSLRILSLIFFGGLSSFGFAPFNLWWATLLGIGWAYHVTTHELYNEKHNKFWNSVFGIFPFTSIYAIGMFWWMLNSIYVVPELAKQFAIWTIPGLIGIGLVGGFIFAIPFVVIRCIRQKRAHRPFLFASIWTFILWLREWFLTGFPWNPIANITMPFPIISNSMSLWGALGLTFIIIGLISSVIEVIKNKHPRKIFLPFFVFLILLTVGVFFGYKNIKIASADNYDKAPIIRIVQPGKSAVEKATYSHEQAIANAEENVKNLIYLAKKNSEPVDLIIFPETTYPYMVVDNNLSISKNLGIKTIIGATSYDFKHFYNSLLIANPNGKIEKLYSKSHLVPFGEYRPFGDLIPTPGLLTPGNGPEILKLTFGKKELFFAPAICYEIIFSDSLIPRDSKNQPKAIINITNDNWFGKTPGTYQHLDMVRRYAIESGLPIVRANYSGISAFISSDGTVESYLPVGEAGSLDGILDGHHMTIYRKLGRDLWMAIILMFSIICVVSISVFQKKD